MAASRLPRPGTEYGPCRKCEHTDCEDVRRMACSDCSICGGPIGYDRRFYRNYDKDEITHAACLEDAVKAGAA